MLTLEVCVDSVESAAVAVRAGADRIELCANLALGGGTTPSMGLLKVVQKAVPDTPIMVMVRPRTGDFLYSDEELGVMVEDIRSFKQCGVRGIVTGVLTADGQVDVTRTKILVDEILPMEVCFHRAFDMTMDVEAAYRDILSIPGVCRILTSGGGKTAPASLDTLKSLFRQAHIAVAEDPSRAVTILPGSGINPKTVRDVLTALLPCGLREIHMSGGQWEDGRVTYRPEGMGMGVDGPSEWDVWRTQEHAIKHVRSVADQFWVDGL